MGFQRRARTPSLWSPRQKPGGVPVVDVSHPLASHLLACWMPVGGSLVDLTRRGATMGPLGAPTMGAGPGGIEAQDNTTSGWTATAPDLVRPVSEFSVYWRGRFITNGTQAENPPLLACYHNATNAWPSLSWGLIRTSSSNANLSLFWNNGTVRNIIATGVLTTGLEHSLMGTVALGGSGVIYTNGAQANSAAAAAGSIAYGAAATLRVGRHITTNNNPGAGFVFGALWGRALTAAEAALMDRDPYGFLIPAF
jgi:hypothetical protein